MIDHAERSNFGKNFSLKSLKLFKFKKSGRNEPTISKSSCKNSFEYDPNLKETSWGMEADDSDDFMMKNVKNEDAENDDDDTNSPDENGDTEFGQE